MSAPTTAPAAPTAPDATVPGSRPPRRIARMLLVVLVISLAASAGAWWFLGEREPTAPGDGEIVTLEPMTTAIGGGGATHARLGIAVVLTDGTPRDAITPELALLEDAIATELAELSSDELRSPDGSRALREELSTRAQEIWGAERVRRVLLTNVMLD